MRMEIAEAELNDNQYSLFTYLDEDGKYGYYMSLGRVYRLIEVKRVLKGNRLCFNFNTGQYTAEAYVTKSAVKTLRCNFNLYQKLHKNK